MNRHEMDRWNDEKKIVMWTHENLISILYSHTHSSWQFILLSMDFDMKNILHRIIMAENRIYAMSPDVGP